MVIAAPVSPLSPDGSANTPQVSERLATYGIQPLPKRGGVVTNELVNRLRDEECI